LKFNKYRDLEGGNKINHVDNVWALKHFNMKMYISQLNQYSHGNQVQLVWNIYCDTVGL